MAIIKSHSTKALSEALTSFLISTNSNIHDYQRILILSSVSSNHAESASTFPNEELMDSVTCNPISSVSSQTDSFQINSAHIPLANSSSFPRLRWSRKVHSPQQIAELKKKSRWKTCGLRRHWHSDHTPHGTLKPQVKDSKSPLTTV